MDIEKQLQELKTAREASAFYKKEMQEMIDNVKQSGNYEVAERGKRTADAKIAELEVFIRCAALDEYDATKNKSIHPKVTVKIFKTFKILDTKKGLGLGFWEFAGGVEAGRKEDRKIRS